MSVLVTGGRGFIGTHLLNLLGEGDTLDIKNGSQKDIRTCNLDKEYTHIFHLAALRSAPLGEEQPEDFISTNCWGTVRLLKRYPKARFLNITSASAEKPMGVYGATKKFAEIMGSLHSNVINVRPYNVFGEGQPVESQAVVPIFIKAMLEGKKPIIYGDGNQLRDFTYVGDLVHELKRIMFKEDENQELYHCGYAKPITITDLVRMIYDKPVEIDYQPTRPFDVQVSKAPYPIKEYYGRTKGLKKTIAWWRNAVSVSS